MRLPPELISILEAELEGVGPFGEIVLRVHVRDGLLHRAEVSRSKSFILEAKTDTQYVPAKEKPSKDVSGGKT